MNENVECDICGCTGFYKESGHYYCNECQTQTQELKEHVFQEEIAVVNVKSTRKIQKPKTDERSKNFTSWEFYNVVMASLTDELINLGAHSNLKEVVRCLWMKYLWKLEVFREDNMLPKLQLVNSRRDAQILLGTKKRKRRSSVSSQSTHTSLDASSLSRDRSRKKRILAQSHYEDFSQKLTESSSHLNQTLTSIKRETDVSKKQSKKITYNTYSVRYLRKKKCLSKRHIKKHREDINHELSCHKFTHKNIKRKFVKDVRNITPTKLYSLLYLGLLINKDNIQLGDLLRFIREGHMSFNHFEHFFPDDFDREALPKSHNCAPISSLTIRKATSELAKFLDVVAYVNMPDIVELSKRLCTEMNLPGPFKPVTTHQVTWRKDNLDSLFLNKLSCFQCNFVECSHYKITEVNMNCSKNEAPIVEDNKVAFSQEDQIHQIFKENQWIMAIYDNKWYPDEIHRHVCTFIAKSPPNLTFQKKHSLTPNYEGRIISVILFTLKLLFGFDTETEFKFSEYACALNNHKMFEQNMFDIKSWLEYISYRDLVVSEYHFPTNFLKDPDNIDSDMFIEYFMQHAKIDENKKLTKQLKDYREVLKLLSDAQGGFITTIEFLPSFTPFKDYSTTIINSGKWVPHLDILKRCFQDDSLEFLLKPHKYLKLLNNKEIKNYGAKTDIQLVKIENKDYARIKKRRDDEKMITCQVMDSGEEKYLSVEEKVSKEMDANILVTNWQNGRQKFHERNKTLLEIVSEDIEIPENLRLDSSYKTHYNPDERYWMLMEQFSLFNFSKEDSRKLVEKYPHTFQIIFNECLRMIEQCEQELIYEFQITELHFAYNCKYLETKSRNVALDARLKNLVNKSKREW